MPSTTIKIKVSDEPDSKALLKDALERESRVIQQGIANTERKVKRLVKALNVKVSELDKVERTEDNEQALIELEGELAILARLKNRKKKLDSIVICA